MHLQDFTRRIEKYEALRDEICFLRRSIPLNFICLDCCELNDTLWKMVDDLRTYLVNYQVENNRTHNREWVNSVFFPSYFKILTNFIFYFSTGIFKSFSFALCGFNCSYQFVSWWYSCSILIMFIYFMLFKIVITQEVKVKFYPCVMS